MRKVLIGCEPIHDRAFTSKKGLELNFILNPFNFDVN